MISSDAVKIDPPLQTFDGLFSSKLVSQIKIDNQLYGVPMFDMKEVTIEEYFQQEQYEIGEQKILTQIYDDMSEEKWSQFDCFPVYDITYEDYTNWIIGLEKNQDYDFDIEKHSFTKYLETVEAVEHDSQEYVLSPIQQIKKGIPPQKIVCKPELTLIFHYDGSPACVKPESIPKLIERGWAKSLVTFSQNVKMDAGFPFKFLDTPPKGFEFVCGEVLYGQGVDVWYNSEKFDCKRVNSDSTLANGGISITFRNHDSENPDERTALEQIQSRQRGIEDKSYIADINGNPALVISKCVGCGMINYNMPNETTISSNYNLPSPNKIQFYDENRIFYHLRSNQSPEILLEIARDLH